VAVLAFAVTLVVLALQPGILLLRAHPAGERQFAVHGHLIALAVGQAAVIAIGLTWFAVATS
jgi:hypothetical protein